ncbi:MAG: peptidoglycan DD-metalloendopeptidase family protein [Syntrophobacterales bacterium]|nr:peptidoglycan DD-metalloendopeptidase family protein [Syntrophobacterales bacterium]
MTGRTRDKALHYPRVIFSHLQIISIKLRDLVVLLLSKVVECGFRLKKRIQTSMDHYTVLIVPQKKSTVKKISATSTHVLWAVSSVAVLIMASCYFTYSYLSFKMDYSELIALKQLSEAQKKQLDTLASKVGYFEKRMESLREYENRIRVMAELVKPKGQYLGVGGPSREDTLGRHEAERETRSLSRIHQSMDQLIAEADQKERSFKEIIEFLEKKKSILARTPSIWPVQGWVTSEFGSRPSPFSGAREFHAGVDIASRSGKEVVAPADGIVSEAERRADLGNAVVVDHGNGLSTLYGHLLQCAVTKGKFVRRGEVLGYVGSTGKSTGSHLHYSVYLNNIPVNPRKYLP